MMVRMGTAGDRRAVPTPIPYTIPFTSSNHFIVLS
jgi:hypothetical protein